MTCKNGEWSPLPCGDGMLIYNDNDKAIPEPKLDSVGDNDNDKAIPEPKLDSIGVNTLNKMCNVYQPKK